MRPAGYGKWKGGRGPARRNARSGALVHAAARGDALDQLLDLGVRRLLVAAAADRAGLWLAGDRHLDTARGRVVEATPGPIPEQWRQLDISTPLLREALEGSELLRVECGPGETMPDLGPLVGMHSATWIPLRIKSCTFGLAMVAHERAGVHPNTDALRACADEIAVAVRHQRESRHRELVLEETHAQVRLSRAILCGVSADSILPQIARAARHYVQAEFIAVGQGSEPPVLGEGWDGPEEWLTALRHGPLLHLWRRAFESGQECEIPGAVCVAKDFATRCSSVFAGSCSSLPVERVVAVPIEARNLVRGVLMAGLSTTRAMTGATTEDSGEDSARLESYALLAASALDREFARDERAVHKRAVRNIIEESRESLVVIDEKGIVRETSRAGAALLFPTWGRLDETRLEDFFASGARDAVAQWLKRIASHRIRLSRWNRRRHSSTWRRRCIGEPSFACNFVRRLKGLIRHRTAVVADSDRGSKREASCVKTRKAAWKQKLPVWWTPLNPGYCFSTRREIFAW